MINFSVGILYSSQSFLEHIFDFTEIDVNNFIKIFKEFDVADSQVILDTALDCKWVYLKTNNMIRITDKGKQIVNCKSYVDKLKIQIKDLIETYKPSWSAKICYGRTEAEKFFSDDVRQCFKEANLLESYDEKVIGWWDQLAFVARGMEDDINVKIGREGEALSIKYEKKRVGIEPTWQSVDTNLSGYDILSQVNKVDKTPLRIEVKATKSSSNKIGFYITNNEWNVALKSNNYIFHIWIIDKKNELFILDKDKMKDNIPENHGYGLWQSVYIEFYKDNIKKHKITY